MARLVRPEKMVFSGLVFARKIARMIDTEYIGFDGSLDESSMMINMAFMPLYM